VPQFASSREIKSAFRRLALEWHPDRYQGVYKAYAQRKFVEIALAYETLGSPERRWQYDTELKNGANGTAGQPNRRNQNKRNAPASGKRVKKCKDTIFGAFVSVNLYLRSSAARLLGRCSDILQKAAGLASERITNPLRNTVAGKSFGAEYRKYKTMSRKMPESSTPYHGLAFYCHRQGKHTEAVRYYRKALKRAPDDADIYCNLGRLREERGQYSKAILCYRKAIELDPLRISVYYSLGNLYMKLGAFSKARQCIDRLKIAGRHELANKVEWAFRK
jgi:curved DNA-binding protein CbpA